MDLEETSQKTRESLSTRNLRNRGLSRRQGVHARPLCKTMRLGVHLLLAPPWSLQSLQLSSPAPVLSSPPSVPRHCGLEAAAPTGVTVTSLFISALHSHLGGRSLDLHDEQEPEGLSIEVSTLCFCCDGAPHMVASWVPRRAVHLPQAMELAGCMEVVLQLGLSAAPCLTQGQCSHHGCGRLRGTVVENHESNGRDSVLANSG